MSQNTNNRTPYQIQGSAAPFTPSKPYNTPKTGSTTPGLRAQATAFTPAKLQPTTPKMSAAAQEFIPQLSLKDTAPHNTNNNNNINNTTTSVVTAAVPVPTPQPQQPQQTTTTTTTTTAIVAPVAVQVVSAKAAEEEEAGSTTVAASLPTTNPEAAVVPQQQQQQQQNINTNTNAETDKVVMQEEEQDAKNKISPAPKTSLPPPTFIPSSASLPTESSSAKKQTNLVLDTDDAVAVAGAVAVADEDITAAVAAATTPQEQQTKLFSQNNQNSLTAHVIAGSPSLGEADNDMLLQPPELTTNDSIASTTLDAPSLQMAPSTLTTASTRTKKAKQPPPPPKIAKCPLLALNLLERSKTLTYELQQMYDVALANKSIEWVMEAVLNDNEDEENEEDIEKVEVKKVRIATPPAGIAPELISWVFVESTQEAPVQEYFQHYNKTKDGTAAGGAGGKRDGDDKSRRGGRGGAKGGAGGGRKEQLPPPTEAAAAKIKMSKDGYKVRRDIAGDEKKLRAVQMILNKLSASNVQTLAEQTKAVGLDTMHLFEQIVKALFDKAIDEPNFSHVYAHFCSYLRNMALVTKDEEEEDEEEKAAAAGEENNNNDEEDGTTEDGVTTTITTKEEKQNNVLFKQRIIQIAKENFEKNEFNQLSAAEVLSLPLEEQNAISAARKRYLGTIKFLGELYKRSLINREQLIDCFDKLLSNLENEEAIESLCHLFINVGQLLLTQHLKSLKNRIETIDGSIPESQVPSDILRIVEKFKTESKDKIKYVPRMRFMMMDTVDEYKKWLLPQSADDLKKKKEQKDKEEQKRIEKERQKQLEKQKEKEDARNNNDRKKPQQQQQQTVLTQSESTLDTPRLTINPSGKSTREPRGGKPSLAHAQSSMSTHTGKKDFNNDSSTTTIASIAGQPLEAKTPKHQKSGGAFDKNAKKGGNTAAAADTASQKGNKFTSQKDKNNKNAAPPAPKEKDEWTTQKGANNNKNNNKKGGAQQNNNNNKNNNKSGGNIPAPPAAAAKAKPAKAPAPPKKQAAGGKFAGFFDDSDEEEEEDPEGGEEEEEQEEEDDDLELVTQNEDSDQEPDDIILGRIDTDCTDLSLAQSEQQQQQSLLRSEDKALLEKLELKLISIPDDYSASYEDPEEVIYAFKEIKKEQYWLVAYQLFVGLEGRKANDHQNILSSGVLEHIPGSQQDFKRGFDAALTRFVDIMIDKPKLPELVGEIVKALTTADKLCVDLALYDVLFTQHLKEHKAKFVAQLK